MPKLLRCHLPDFRYNTFQFRSFQDQAPCPGAPLFFPVSVRYRLCRVPVLIPVCVCGLDLTGMVFLFFWYAISCPRCQIGTVSVLLSG